MKNAKKLLLIFLVLTLALALFACSKCKHTDEDNNDVCDKCGEALVTEVKLFDNGTPNFQFVLASDLSKNAKNLIDEYIENMEDIDVDIYAVEDEEDTIESCEVLVGNVTSRGEKYIYDSHKLGSEGYIIQIIGTKIIICAGSDETLESAIEEFIEDILLYDEDAEDMGTIIMTRDDEVLEVQEYDIKALKVNGADMNGYKIAYDSVDYAKVYKELSKSMQSVIYENTGYWFEVIKLSEAAADDKLIIFRNVPRVKGEDGFKVSADSSGNLLIECMYDNKLKAAVDDFIAQTIILTTKEEINFKNEVFTKDISFLTYEEIGGAKGNGRTDDFVALYKTHVEANKFGQTVKATAGKTYYIKDNMYEGAATSIPIKTDVDWTGAKFIIDDKDLNMFDTSSGGDRMMGNRNIFEVLSDYPVTTISGRTALDAVLAAGLNRETTNIDLGLGYAAMIIPTNNSHKVYRRKGYGGFEGGAMHEVIVIDKDGNVDLTSESATPIMFNYTSLDKIDVYRLEGLEPLTIKGGTVTHIGNRVDARYVDEDGKEHKVDYAARGLGVYRSYTTVIGLEHLIENEITPGEFEEWIANTGDETGFESVGYHGFFYAETANEVKFKDCVLTGRRYYYLTGTYDFGATDVNKIVLEGCTQSNFWVTYDTNTKTISPAASREEAGAVSSMAYVSIAGYPLGKLRMHWGIGGTNYCKNMEYINSQLSRFDAHAGLCNGKIIGSEINYFALTGQGDFYVEDTIWYADSPGAAILPLRADYGSTWEGTIYFKNLDAYIDTSDPSKTTYFLQHSFNNWYYGYKAHIPNFVIDNLDLYEINNGYKAAAAGTELVFIDNTIINEPALHLSEVKNVGTYASVYPYVDKDGDGIVDNTNTPYSAEEKGSNWAGIKLADSSLNLNPIGIPEVIKIINNDGVNGTGGYKFIVPSTYGLSKSLEDESSLPEELKNGGFFGTTKFYYGTGENDYYHGTNHTGDLVTFIFR